MEEKIKESLDNLGVALFGNEEEKAKLKKTLDEKRKQQWEERHKKIKFCLKKGYLKEEEKHIFENKDTIDFLDILYNYEEIKEGEKTAVFVTNVKILLEHKHIFEQRLPKILIKDIDEAVELIQEEKETNTKKDLSYIG